MPNTVIVGAPVFHISMTDRIRAPITQSEIGASRALASGRRVTCPISRGKMAQTLIDAHHHGRGLSLRIKGGIQFPDTRHAGHAAEIIDPAANRRAVMFGCGPRIAGIEVSLPAGIDVFRAQIVGVEKLLRLRAECRIHPCGRGPNGGQEKGVRTATNRRPIGSFNEGVRRGRRGFAQSRLAGRVSPCCRRAEYQQTQNNQQISNFVDHDFYPKRAAH